MSAFKNSLWIDLDATGQRFDLARELLTAGTATVVLAGRIALKILFAMLCLLLSGCAEPRRTGLAIRGATVVNVTDGSLLTDQSVLIEDSRIVAVGPADEVQVPGDAEVVEAEGKYLIPGFWDMHVHSVANVALDMRIESVAAWEWHFPLFLAHGVTGVRNMNDGAGELTLELANSVKHRLTEGELAGPPRFLNCGPSLDGDPPLASSAVIVRTAADAQAAVEQLASHGADLVKVYENLSREAYFAILDEARRQGLPVDGHAPFRITPEEVAEAGQRTVEHPEAIAAACAADADAERRRFGAALADQARMRLVPEAIRRNWEQWGADQTTEEFQSVEAGLTHLEALQAATINPVRVLGLADSLGTIDTSKLADLVLLEANPLEDITNTREIHAVVADGQLYRRADLDKLLAEARQRGTEHGEQE